ncbi:MAG: AMP-binding protein, partial [Ruminococcus sp.]|nr:AMP-binding protein [Ruminococcus sp.]
HIGAQPVPPSLISRWKEKFPEHKYDTNYGLSESIGPGCVHLGVDNIHKVGAIGKAGFGWEVKIADESGNTVERGQVGELYVKGAGVMTCYYRDEKATAETLKDGWLLTGDMAQEDEDGFIYLVDRKKDVIISGGENLYPVQIEDFLRSHPAVKDVAVIGLPDKRLGEIAAAIISVKDGMTCTEDEINTFCQKMPRYKRPHKVIFADVPRNPTGKIEKPKLREIYCGESLVAAQIKN